MDTAGGSHGVGAELVRLFRRRPTDAELDRELQFHLEELIASHLRDGVEPGEARRRALVEFGQLDPAKEAMRDIRWMEPLRRWWWDLGYAMRYLWAAPGFTMAAVLSLALGIGANTALFSILNTALLRLIPVERPEELVWFTIDPADGSGRRLNYPFWESLQGDRRWGPVFCTFATTGSVSDAAKTERVELELVSGNYFGVLGVKPLRGRLIAPDDDRHPMGHPVAVVSHAYWQGQMASDDRAVGRTLRINGTAFTVIGVTPPGFAGSEPGFRRMVFVPMKMKRVATPGWDALDKPLVSWLQIGARLPAGADRVALGHELHARYHAFQRTHLDADRKLTPGQKEYFRRWQLSLETMRDAALDRRVRDHLKTLAWVVAALLALACANLAGLLLARGLDRQREIATRLALGAGRWRVVAQLLTESLLLGLGGGAAGLMLGSWCAPAIARQFPLAGAGSEFEVRLDATVFAFTLAVSLVACLAFGLLPALQSTRLDLLRAIKGAGQSRERRRVRQWLLAAQVAIAVVLLTVAGGFGLRLQAVLATDVGFNRERMLVAEIEPMLLNYSNTERIALYRRLEGKLHEAAKRTGSGFTAAALSTVIPMSHFNWSTLFFVDGKPRDVIPRANQVGPGYFQMMGIPLRQGRLLDERDDAGAPRAAVVSERTARMAFPEGDALGRHFMADPRAPRESTFEIVGIVGDIELNDPRRPSREMVYFPYRQWPFPAQAMAIQVRLSAEGSVGTALTSIRQAVAECDGDLPLYGARTTEESLDMLLAAERLSALLGGFFALAAALLSAIGLYGVLAHEVALRRREFGVRLALGATTRLIVWPLMRETIVFTLAGVAAGLLALAAGGLWQSSVAPAAVAVLLLAASIAAWLPGRRAARIEPAAALRCD